MGWDVLLFDLDGTLTDSGPGIMHAAETALGSFGQTGDPERSQRSLSRVHDPRPGICQRSVQIK